MAKKSFTPNMSTAEIAEYDKRRGYGDVDLFANPTVVSLKKPWQNPDGTHKAHTEEETYVHMHRYAANCKFMIGSSSEVYRKRKPKNKVQSEALNRISELLN